MSCYPAVVLGAPAIMPSKNRIEAAALQLCYAHKNCLSQLVGELDSYFTRITKHLNGCRLVGAR